MYQDNNRRLPFVDHSFIKQGFPSHIRLEEYFSDLIIIIIIVNFKYIIRSGQCGQNYLP